MNIDYLLKKEGLQNIQELNSNQIKTIAKDIAIKLCLAFPEHDLDRQALYNSFCSLDMYTATMPKDSSGAKYISSINAIYFNENLEFSSIPEVAMHECLHFIQEKRFFDKSKSIGLTSFNHGLALNEASIQLMASEANMCDMAEEKYFDISIKTISPNYYPLECTLVNELSYFTGTYSLYNSTLNSNDVFKSTFIAKFNKKIYKNIVRNLDKLLTLESDLNSYINELETTENVNTLKWLNDMISEQKQNIKALFFNTQNYIIKNCFSCEFDNIRTADDLKSFKENLYNFKDILGSCDGYSYYNEFYCDSMNAVENKKEEIEKYGEISLFKEECMALTLTERSKEKFNFVKLAFTKLHKLFKYNRSTVNNYNEYKN